MKNNRTKHLHPTGYQLASERIKQAPLNKNSKYIVTVKYPLKGDLKGKLESELIEQSFRDYAYAYGIPTLKESKPQVSLIDFYIECLRMGAFFQPSSAKLQDLASGGKLQALIKKNIPDHILVKLNMLEFVDGITADFRKMEQEEPATFRKKIAKWFKDDTDPYIDQVVEIYLQNGQSQQTQSAESAFFYRPKKNPSNLTFYLHPEILVDPSESNPQKVVFESVRQIYTALNNQLQPPEKKREDFDLELIGLDKQANALSNFFNNVFNRLQKDDVQSLMAEILDLSELWRGKEQELEQRLIHLSSVAKQVGNPALGKSWADYRAMFSGRIKSWYKNTVNHLKAREEQLPNLKEAVEVVIADVRQVVELITNKSFDERDNSNRTELLFHFLESCQALLDALDQNNEDVCFQLHAELTRDFNLVLQRYAQEFLTLENSKKKKKQFAEDSAEALELIRPKYAKLFSRLRPQPAFFGEQRAKLVDRYSEAAKQLFQLLTFLQQLILDLYALPRGDALGEETLLQIVDKVVKRKNNANTINHQQLFKDLFTQAIIRPYTKDEKVAYFINPNASRLRLRKLEKSWRLPDVELVQMIESTLLKSFNLSQEAYSHADSESLIDAIESSKTLVAVLLLTRKSTQYSFDFEKIPSETLRFKINRLDKKNRVQYLQRATSFIGTELRGYISLISRSEVIDRATVQLSNSDKMFTPVRTKDNRWKIALNHEKAAIGLDQEVEKFTKSGVKREVLKHQTLDIKTSRYQLQFLEWLHKTPKKKQHLNIALNEPSLIAEKKYRINWTVQNQILVPEYVLLESGVFLSIPFTISPAKDNNKSFSRYLGLDLGEFGVAWAVLGIKDNRPYLVQTGMLQDPQLRAIANEVAVMKARQVTGTFGVPSSRLQRLRESAVHSLVNQIHSLVLRYGAKMVFERQVDAFQTGSNRVKKIYASLKQGNIFGRKEIDKSNYKRYWSYRDGHFMGSEVSSWGTSYFCPHCREFLHDLPKEKDAYELVKDSPEELTRLRVYSVKQTGEKYYGYVEGNSSPKEQVLAFARPPYQSDALLLLSKQGKNLNLSQSLKTERGGQAVFVCPKFSCLRTYDADKQAAVNIAMRKWAEDVFIATKGKPPKQRDENYFRMRKDFERKLYKDLNEYPTVKMGE